MCFATAALATSALGAGALPTISGAAGIAGAATTAIGTLEGGAATKNAATYQAQVAANNAEIAKRNANYSEEAGQAQAAAVSLKGAATAGKIKTAQAASGVSVNTGSNVDVQISDREVSKLNAEQTLSNADLQAYGYRTAATGYEAESQLDLEEAKQAPIGADLAAAGGVLSSASSLGLKWANGPTPPGSDTYWTPGTPGYSAGSLGGVY
jgi:hypothetical protein